MAWGVLFRAERLVEQGALSDAVEILRRRLRENPRVSPRHLNLLGTCEARLGHREMAREVFSDVLAAHPHNVAVLTNLGNLSLLDGNHQTARDYYVRALHENAFLKEPRFNLVRCYQDMGHFEKALTTYEEYDTVAKMSRWAAIAFVALTIALLLLFARH